MDHEVNDMLNAHIAGATVLKPIKKKVGGVTIQKKQAMADIVVTQADGTKTQTAELVGEPMHFVAAPCTIEVGAELKIGLPNYSSAGCSVKIHIPCAAGEIDEVADFAEMWVDKRMALAAEKLDQAKKA